MRHVDRTKRPAVGETIVNRCRVRIYLAFTALLVASPAFATDNSFRCPRTGRIVHEGDTMAEVLNECGEPELSTPAGLRIRRINKVESIAIQIEEWTYDFGPHRFIQILRFENGRLQSIERGGYGTAG